MRIGPHTLGAVAIVIAVGFVPAFADGYLQYLVNLVLVYAVIGIGLNMLLGYAGQFAFAHAAFMGIGAYAACILTSRLGLSYWLALPAAGAITTLIGALAALPALRMKRVYLALATLAFAELIVWILIHWKDVTQGTNGISIEHPFFFGIELRKDAQVFWVIYGTFLVMALAAWRILHSRIGRAFVAIKESELVARCNGISVARTKAVAFCLSAFYAGIGGALFALSLGFISPENFGLNQIALHFSIVVIGGLASLPGAVIGAAVVILLPEVLRAVQGYEELVYGVTLMLFILFMPGGIASLLRRLRILPPEVLAAPPRAPARDRAAAVSLVSREEGTA